MKTKKTNVKKTAVCMIMMLAAAVMGLTGCGSRITVD